MDAHSDHTATIEEPLNQPTWKEIICSVVMATIMTLYFSNGDHGNRKSDGNIFCYVTDFTHGELDYDPVSIATSAFHVTTSMDLGQPFIVKNVSDHWPATNSWSHAYFQEIFKGHDLFSSTFSTTQSPNFDLDYPNKEIYYGIFLNNHSLATVVANDYQYPDFIPDHLRLHGNEWVHWGHPPCGAKRHMDLTCTGRISVQISGKKRWRFYPLISDASLFSSHWTEILRPLEVILEPGDALVWFPGWEHETGIETGPSISLSLHFIHDPNSNYLHTFHELLSNRISNSCHWN